MVRNCIHLYFGGAALFLGFLLSLLTGCANFRQMEMPPLSENLPAIHALTAVPFYPQEEYQCGPAALAMAISWSGLPVRSEDLVEEVYTPSRKGSLQTAMIAAARRPGRLAYEISDFESLFPEIAASYPVIVLQNLGISWFPVWHYGLVVGYDATQGHVIIRSGTTFRKVLPLGVFEKTWARSSYWGIIILQPGQLPALDMEKTYLSAVLGLEKAHQFQAAVSGYRTALSRWPQSLAARMGLGNSYYALGDFTNSEIAFKEIIHLHPRAGAAYNNLSQILKEQGRYPEAMEMAPKAVSLDGPLKATYYKTLQEIESKMSQQK
jgi:tetratricopeptide (TPR) repeat protein